MRRGLLATAIAMTVLLSTSAIATTSYTIVDRDDWLPAAVDDDEACKPLQDCKALEGLAIRDLDISDEMDQADALYGSDYTVRASVADLTATRSWTGWTLCWYDSSGAEIDCAETQSYETNSDLLIAKNIDHNADTLRVMLKGSVDAVFHVDVVAKQT